VTVSPFFTATWMPQENPAAPTPLAWPMRYTTDSRPYALDLENWLLGTDDTVASFRCGVTGSDITLSNPAVVGAQCVVTVSGGGAGEVAEIDFIVTTANGTTASFAVSVATSTVAPTTAAGVSALAPPNGAWPAQLNFSDSRNSAYA
jgi:hypothetical protein